MNKKGQFFLIAAVVIAGIIITMSTIYITTKPAAKEQTALYDLSKEIDYESSQLIDYGVYNSQSFSETNRSIDSFIKNYSLANPDTDIVLVFGGKQSLTAVLYTKSSSGTIDVGSGGSGSGLQQYGLVAITLPYEIKGNTVIVKLNENSSLEFELQEGENFFIVLKKQAGEETIVAQQ